MAHQILADTAASISELKRNPMGTVAAGEGLPVAILNRNEPAFYCVPARVFEALMSAQAGSPNQPRKLGLGKGRFTLPSGFDDMNAEAIQRMFETGD